MKFDTELNLELVDGEWAFEFTDHDRIVARAVVVDDEGYFHFVEAVRDDIFGCGTLIETSGGGVEPGEELLDAIQRELSEELGVQVEIISKIGVVSDYYNLIHRHNINNYYLCKIVGTCEKRLTDDEVNYFHLSTLKLRFDEAVRRYAECTTTKLGRLIYNREMPILLQAHELLAAEGTPCPICEAIWTVAEIEADGECTAVGERLRALGFTDASLGGCATGAAVHVDIINKRYIFAPRGVSLGFNIFTRSISVAELWELLRLLDLSCEPSGDYCRALTIAAKNHRGQFDKVGKEYLLHPLTVSNYCTTKRGKVAGLLHDVVEDTDVTLGELLGIFDAKTVLAVKLVTKTADYKTDEYYAAIKENPVAREVKMADLTHNMDLRRFAGRELTEWDIARNERYREFYNFLLK